MGGNTMHYDMAALLGVARPIGDAGYSLAEVELRAGDTAVAPGTTKQVLWGTGTLKYMIHASGVTVDSEGAEVRLVLVVK